MATVGVKGLNAQLSVSRISSFPDHPSLTFNSVSFVTQSLQLTQVSRVSGEV